ncbi:MAG: response regulator transcription factor [Synechococcaceae cyanobacterium RL_1_2]|nr:response regulator transcription factor [Synechococcaceae cyanobacterium RL_1_2]
MTKKPIKFLVVEDHEFHLTSTVDNLNATYPTGIIHTASTYNEAAKELETFEPDLLVLDLQIPLDPSEPSLTQHGVTLLEKILDREDSDAVINVAIVTQSPQALVRIKDKIHNYSHGGITATDKSSGTQILQDIHLALKGGSRINHIEALRSQQLKPNWYQLLQLAWYEELSDQRSPTNWNSLSLSATGSTVILPPRRTWKSGWKRWVRKFRACKSPHAAIGLCSARSPALTVQSPKSPVPRHRPRSADRTHRGGVLSSSLVSSRSSSRGSIYSRLR